MINHKYYGNNPPCVAIRSKEMTMALVPNNTLMTATPDEDREPAIMLALKNVAA